MSIESDLLEALKNGKLSLDTLEASKNEMEAYMKRKETLAKHHTPITQLPNGRYYTRVNGRKIERSTREAVEDAIVNIIGCDNETFESTFEHYLATRKMTVSDNTWSKDIYLYNRYLKGSPLGKKPIKKITLDDGYAFLNYCLKINPNMKKRYWNNIKGLLGTFIQYYLDRGLIAINPFANLKPKKDLFAPPKQTRDSDTVFSYQEQITVIEFAELDSKETESAIPLGIVILFMLALRCGELCALKWGDIETDIRGTYIHVQREMVVNIDANGNHDGFTVLDHCKTPAGDRRLLLNNRAKETFNRIKRINEANGIPTGDDDYVFQRWEKNELKLCSSRSFDPRLRKYCRKAGMTVIKSCHDIRRTALTNLYNAGMPLKKIQEYAGHASLKQTMDYIRISDNDVDIVQYVNSLDIKNHNVRVFQPSAKSKTL